MLPLHLQPQSHVPLYIQLRDQLRALVHAGDLRPGDRIPASRELATMLGVHRTTVANAYAELESEGLIQGHVGRGTFIKGNGNGLKITPPAPPVLNGNGGIRWELLFADERGEEVLSRLTAGVPGNALSFVMACPAPEFFPIDELQICVNAVLRRKGRSEEHTSELQSRLHLVCRLLLEKKKKIRRPCARSRQGIHDRTR